MGGAKAKGKLASDLGSIELPAGAFEEKGVKIAAIKPSEEKRFVDLDTDFLDTWSKQSASVF